MQIREFDVIVDIKNLKKPQYRDTITQQFINEIEVVRDDYKSNKLHIYLEDGNKQYPIGDNNVTVVFKKYDGTLIAIEKGNEDITINNDVVSCVLGSNITSLPGRQVYAEINISGTDGERLTSSVFLFRVRKGLLTEEAIKSTSELPFLDRLIDEVGTLDEDLRNNESAREVAEDNRNTNFNNLVASADETKQNLNASIILGNESLNNLDSSIDVANSLNDNLEGNISVGDMLNNNLDDNIQAANLINNTLNNEVDGTVKRATDINITLMDSIDDGIGINTTLVNDITIADNLNDDLVQNIGIADTSNENLVERIGDGRVAKANLDGSIDIALTENTNLDDSIATSITKKSELDDSISLAVTKKTDLDSSISSANTINNTLSNATTGTIKKATDINTTLNTSIGTANTSKSNLDTSVGVANTSKTNLDESVATANSSKSNLDSSVTSANTKKSELDTSISNADTINNTLANPITGNIKKATDINSTLSGNISTATTRDADLKATIVNANTSNGDLDTSIENSITAKSNLDDSITTANTTKAGLDGSITTGNALKSELGDIISGTDYEQVIIDVNSMKQDQHSHTNKNTLDGLSDVNGNLKYDGQDVGIGDMEKSIYDIDGDGKVDVANNSEKLGGQLPSYYTSKTYADGELNKKLNSSMKGSNNGLAELDNNGKVPSSQLPSYVDDVLEYVALSNFPTTGETGKIYTATSTNLIYRWSGSGYVEISSTIALGETSSTAYRGDRGRIAYDHSQMAHAPSNAQKNSDITKAEIEAKLTGSIATHSHITTKVDVGLGNVDDTSDLDKPISNATQIALDGKIDNLEDFHVSDALGYTPANATNEHTHTNKSTIDKFTEVDNKPYYNGEEIGGAVPNLTLTELTLGGRFKIVYNDIEDSLDIEVV